MDLTYLFDNLQNYEETKVVRKEIMKDSNKEKYVSLVSQKEAMKHINDSDNSDQGEESALHLSWISTKKVELTGLEDLNSRE